jgi:predicted acylesterase/phospholipase RssA
MFLTPTGYPRPKILVLASGGIRVLSYVGALEELHTHGCLAGVETLCGVSGGALIATALAFGYTYTELREICERFDFGVLKHIDEQSPIRLLEGCFGLDSGEMLSRFCSALAHVKGLDDDITFGELAARGRPELRIWCADLESGRLRTFSASTTPGFSVLAALRASMSIPLVYEPVAGPSGEMLVDGALINAYPIYTLTAAERASTLGIVPRPNRRSWTQRSITGYLFRCWNVLFEHRSDPIVELFRKSTVIIEISTIAATDFDLTADERISLVVAGRRAARRYLRDFKAERTGRILKIRRHSVS